MMQNPRRRRTAPSVRSQQFDARGKSKDSGQTVLYIVLGLIGVVLAAFLCYKLFSSSSTPIDADGDSVGGESLSDENSPQTKFDRARQIDDLRAGAMKNMGQNIRDKLMERPLRGKNAKGMLSDEKIG